MARGKLITLDGIDGAGKSSHIATTVELIRREKNVEVVSTREPGGTPLGEKIRALLLHESMRAETELLLMFAARCEHLREVIEPALQRGAWVVSDRFTDASFAYQGGGRGIAPNRIEILERWVQGELQPDLTLLFDIDAAGARARLAASGTATDRFEVEQAAFFERVRAAYLARAHAFPERIRVIDSSATLHRVSEQVTHALLSL